MTTEIIVNAHCSDEKEVLIITRDEGEYCDESILQNGDSETFYAYDEREIIVKERSKE